MQVQTVDYDLEKTLAAHLSATTWDDLPRAARRQAIRAVLWSLATCLEGAMEPDQPTVLDYIARQGGRDEATVIGSGLRTTAELAGLANGRAAKSWEHEDKWWVDETVGFGVACCVVPAALAVAEARGGVSGTLLATAVALGIDLEARLFRPLGLGFIPGRCAANATFVFGTYGAAAAAGKILGLGPDGFIDALGLAHSQASGNYQGQAEGRGVSLQAGIAVRNGIAAARLAALGMPGPRGSIGGRVGLYEVHYPKVAIDFAGIAADLGSEWLNVRLGFKGYPCGVVAHPAIDAILAARPEVAGRDVAGITVTGPESLGVMARPIEVKRAPASATEAQFSIPWAAACALRDGHFSIDHFDASALADPELRALAAKVSVEIVPSFVGNVVEIALADGTVVAPPKVLASKGHPNNPLATEEIEAVLERAARRLDLPEADVARAVGMMRALEAVGDVGEIVALLSRRG